VISFPSATGPGGKKLGGLLFAAISMQAKQRITNGPIRLLALTVEQVGDVALRCLAERSDLDLAHASVDQV